MRHTLLTVAILAATNATAADPLDGLSDAEKTYITYQTTHSTNELPEKIIAGSVMHVPMFGRSNLEIVDDKNSIIHIIVRKQKIRIGAGTLRQINSFYDDEGNSYWLEGVDTSSWASGEHDKLKLPENTACAVVGNKSYRTVLGASNTVHHLIAVDTKKLDPIVESMLASKGFRTWTHRNGEQIRAKPTSLGNTVKLELLNGEEIQVLRQQLSEADQKWMREEMKRKRAGA